MSAAVSVFSQERFLRSEEKGGSKLESWYHMLTLGWILDNTSEGMPGRKLAVAVDILRFYFPLSKKMMLGAGINSAGYTYTYQFVSDDVHRDIYDNIVLMYYILYSGSLQYYFKSIGDGFFLRADLGLSKGRKLGEIDTETFNYSTKYGFGFLIGCGYALPISRETSVLFMATYRSLKIEGHWVSSIALQTGWLW